MPLPILSVAQMRAWERATWRAGRTESDVISRVGHVLAARMAQLTRAGDPILVLAGKGHNGDDARQALPHLADRELSAIDITDPQRGLREFRSLLALKPIWIIDALFGIGLNRPLNADWIRLIDAINQSLIPVLSVDVPSGLDADTGRDHGAAVAARITLTLGAPKRGLLQPQAAAKVGRLEVAPDIGLIPCPVESKLAWTLADDFDGYPPPRSADGHKGSFGHLVILAGSTGYHGAAVLAARGAHRARPGLVTLITTPGVYVPVASQLQSTMVRSWSSLSDIPSNATALVCGPGLAGADVPEGLKEAVVRLWKTATIPMLVDASALDWICRKKPAAKAIRVVTPHPGEAARMLNCGTGELQADRTGHARALSKQHAHAWAVLKGQHTLVGNDRGKFHCNSSGNAGLAQGGSGDLLAGFLGGLLAQPALQGDPLALLQYGVWSHGAAADRLEAERANWTVEDLAEAIGGR